MTMKLQYYDNAPEEYEPPGFKPCDMASVPVQGNPPAIVVGTVGTEFHSVKLRIKTRCHQFSEQEKMEAMLCEEPVDQTNEEGVLDSQAPASPQIGCDQKEADMKEQIDVNDDVQDEEEPIMEEDKGEKEKKEIQDVNDEEEVETIVLCPCGDNQDDGLMVQCENCTKWQHAVCFGFLCGDNVPSKHYCDVCAERGSKERPPSDPLLCLLNPVTLQATCLWRRALMACSEGNRVLVPSFARRLGVEVNVAQGIIHRLEREGFVSTATKGKRLGKVVHRDKILSEGVQKYFKLDGKSNKASGLVTAVVEEQDNPLSASLKPVETEDTVASVTAKTSTMKISGEEVQRKSVKRQLKDEDLYDFNSSQEVESSPSRKRRYRKASIARKVVRV